MERHNKAMERLTELKKLKHERQNKYLILESFIKGIEARPLVLDEFDDKLWAVAIKKVRVMPDGKLAFNFKDGSKIEGWKVNEFTCFPCFTRSYAWQYHHAVISVLRSSLSAAASNDIACCNTSLKRL